VTFSHLQETNHTKYHAQLKRHRLEMSSGFTRLKMTANYWGLMTVKY